MSVVYVRNARLFKDYKVQVVNLDDAYEKGYFNGSMTRWEVIDRIVRANTACTVNVYSSATHRGLFIDNEFICGIGHDLTIPRFTFIKFDPSKTKTLHYANQWGEEIGTKDVNMDRTSGRILMRSWCSIFNFVKKAGYEVDDRDLSY